MIWHSLEKALFATVAVLSFSTSYAGGDSWRFTVTGFSSDYTDKYVVELTPIERGGKFPNSCTTLTISGDYASSFWFFKFGDGPSRTEHKAALAMLRDSFKSKTPIEFGWIGDGIDVSKATEGCFASSRGLAIENAAAGNAVYSYFKWP